MPDHPNLPVTLGADGFNRAGQRFASAVELVIAANDLENTVAFVSEHSEVSHQLQEAIGLHHATQERLHLLWTLGRKIVLRPSDRAPRHKPIFASTQRPNTCHQAIRRNQRSVRAKERRDLLLVSLKLIEGVLNRRVLAGRVLQLDHDQWQAIHKGHDIGAAVMAALNNGELVRDHQIVIRGIHKINQTHLVAFYRAIRAAILNVDPVDQQPMNAPVFLNQRWGF